MAPLALFCQPKGTINGQPIPDRVFDNPRAQVELAFAFEHKRPPAREDQAEITQNLPEKRCGRLKDAVRRAIRDDQMNQLAVKVTDADIAEYEKKLIVKKPEDEYKWHTEHATTLLLALDAVALGEDAFRLRGADKTYRLRHASQVPRAGRNR